MPSHSADVLHVGLQAAGRRADPGAASRRRVLQRQQRLLDPRGGPAALRHDALRGSTEAVDVFN